MNHWTTQRNPADSFARSLPGDRAHITITRWFVAPPDVLWRRYTDPRHLAQFYGAPGCTHPICEMDMRPGGTWRHTLPNARWPMAAGRWPMADGR